MRMKNLNNTAFSLLEVLLSSVIFVIAVAGIFATFNAVRTPATNTESALTAAAFGKQVLETLRIQVNQQASANFYSCASVNGNGTCGDFALSVGVHQISVATLATVGLSWPSTALSNQNLVGGVPVVAYTVSCADGTPSHCTDASTSFVAHRVDLTINW